MPMYPPIAPLTLSENPSFAQAICTWQKQHGRHHLPWQNTRDPYRIWVSEIMLQQTQVTTVIPYYQRFMTHFPTVATLAKAPLDEVLSHWSGLGYYARARHLHEAAQRLHIQGCYPDTSAGWATLPGIGRSTAAAIVAFSLGQRATILDGNVKRILTRYFFLKQTTQADLWRLADHLVPDNDIESYTQGLMDLGSLVCTRTCPSCLHCPLQHTCQAYHSGQFIDPQPVRKRITRTRQDSHLLLIHNTLDQWLVIQRPKHGIWAGLWSFPEEPQTPSQALGYSLCLGDWLSSAQPLKSFVHLLTHREWHFHPYVYHLSGDTPLSVHGHGVAWLTAADIAKLAIPAPVRDLLPRLNSIRDGSLS